MTGVSRRDLFANLLTPFSRAVPRHPVAEAPNSNRPRQLRTSAGTQQYGGSSTQAEFAVIQGRFCLAYQRSFCSVCSERCPVPDAIIVENGIPRVNWDACTGCGVCHEVCPAPRNAVLMLPKRPEGKVSAATRLADNPAGHHVTERKDDLTL
jgi:Pyruvate/2-oxoacid:ferredoxin oxidoreductase delta subunit